MEQDCTCVCTYKPKITLVYIYILYLFTECNVKGESEHNVSQHQYQRTSESGVFLFPDPIPCTGTLVAVNATGFCTLSGKVNNQFDRLRLLVFECTNNQFRRAGTTSVMADCQSTESSGDYAGESDYSMGTVSSQTVNISVCSGYYLAVRFSSDCSDTTCPFQPASINSSTTHVLYFEVPDGSIESLDGNGERRDVSFLFSASIVTNNGMYVCIITMTLTKC